MTEQTRRSLPRTPPAPPAPTGFAAGFEIAPASAAPLVRRDRPVLTHGIQSGDVTTDSAIVWTRADRPSHMVVEIARDPSFRGARRYSGPMLTPDTGGTGKL